jgi:hypothetical protein
MNESIEAFVGCDLGDRYSEICVTGSVPEVLVHGHSLIPG